MNFKELGLSDDLIDSISYMGFEKATPIQEQAIPKIIDGKDLIACAQTGTGKTAAFILPIINKLAARENSGISTIVICPTRELAIQIDQAINGFTYFTSISSIAIYGGGDGDDWEDQKKALTSGVDIVVATPGKFIAHLNMGYMDLTKIEHVILDEADRMLDIGFHDDILRIFSYFPKKRQTLMFSATMPRKIRDLATEILKSPDEISIAISKPAEGVLQMVYLCYDTMKTQFIKRLIDGKESCKTIIIFSSTKREVTQIVRGLRNNKYLVEGISSDLDQKQREAVLIKFRAKQCRVLVATDVMSRGIDIKDINLVINYNVPNDAEDYVHRIGRTARADTTGIAVTLVNPEEMYKFLRIERLIEKEVLKSPIPPEIGESPTWNPKAVARKGKGPGKGHGGKGGGGRNFKGKPRR
ncbi:MAG TPA: ATP-dependent RNA helicase [Flavobacteriales bacterium]|nr:DEAD/DEAH box helicase [Salibacteraceae bacterium]HAW21324.1 ATP-dependent RNA helicase [Flavobacteriales bacterium]